LILSLSSHEIQLVLTITYTMSQPFINLSDGKVTIGGNVNIGSNGPTQDIKFTDSDGKVTVLKKVGNSEKKE
jgi:hypothetical protein